MTRTLNFAVNTATASAIAGHLRASDSSFIPPLSERVEIDCYARKIAVSAERLEAWSDGILAGLIAAYCNEPLRDAAYITKVSVIPEFGRQGIAQRLLGMCLERCNDLGFARVLLDVDGRNAGALTLYEKHGFVRVPAQTAEQACGPSVTMQLILRQA